MAPTNTTTTTDTTKMINISPDNIAGNCYFKCDYKFDYSACSEFAISLVTNAKDTDADDKPSGNLLLTPTSSPAVAPVNFNGQTYILNNISIYSPSIHNFSSYVTDAEMILKHTSASGKTLFVAIPIIIQTSSTAGSFLDQVIQNAGAMVSASPAMTSSPITLTPVTSLSDLIPMDPYYTYNNTNMAYISPNNPPSSPVAADWVVFGRPSALHITHQNLNSLTSIITSIKNNTLASSNTYSVLYPPDSSNPGTAAGSSLYEKLKMYFNVSGPTHLNVDDNEIYIDCQPTNASEETIPAPSPSPISNQSFIKTTEFQTFLRYLMLAGFVLGLLTVFWFIPTFIGERGSKGGTPVFVNPRLGASRSGMTYAPAPAPA